MTLSQTRLMCFKHNTVVGFDGRKDPDRTDAPQEERSHVGHTSHRVHVREWQLSERKTMDVPTR
jgi:hypothetical protein